MTHREIKILDDGTRVYADGHTYTPRDRVNGVNRPDHPEAVRFHAKWFLPLEFLPDELRAFPPTREDREAYDHMGGPAACTCEVCRRPEARVFKDRWRKDQKRKR